MRPALLTAATTCLVMAAFGAVEAAIRLAAWSPVLYDSRADAVAFAWWSIALAAAYGAAAGFVAGLLLARRLGVGLASLVAPAALLLAWGGAHLLEPALGIAGGAWTAAAVVTLILLAGAALAPHRETPARIPWMAAGLLLLVTISVPAFLRARIAFGSPAPPDGARNVLLITIDTLRADALGAFRRQREVPPGLEKSLTPALDALAARSFAFVEASTPVPKTPQAISSLMTGDYTYRHGFETLFSTLSWTNRTLAETFRARGWVTAAVLTNGLIDRGSGISQGFDIYRGRLGLRGRVKRVALLDLVARLWSAPVTILLNRFDTTRPQAEVADVTTSRAIRMLHRVEDRPFFLWVHYLDPHWTYEPPEPFRGQVDPSPDEPLTVYDDIASGRLKIGDVIHHNAMTPAEVERLNSLYAGEVRFLDDQVRRLIEAASSGPAGDRTILVVTADHGESLGEHGYFFSHGDRVYQQSLHIPLMFHLPGQDAGRIIDTPVSLIDVMPTLLDMFDLGEATERDGESLTAELRPAPGTPGNGGQEREIFSESDLSYLSENPLPTIPGEAGKLRSIRIGRHKLILVPHDHDRAKRIDPDLGAADVQLRNVLGFSERTTLGPTAPDAYELYDLEEDPGETRDLSAAEPELVKLLARRLDEFLVSSLGSGSNDRHKKDDELLDTLRSLGYIE